MKKLLFLAVLASISQLNGAAFDDSRTASQCKAVSIHNHEQLQGKNAFTILGLIPGATYADIEKRYHKLADKLNPDRNPEARGAFKVLRSAYLKIATAGPKRSEEILKYFNKER